MERAPISKVLLVSIVLVVIACVAWAASWVWSAGWQRTDESWVIVQGSGLMELHTTQRRVWIVRGRFEILHDERLSAAIPAGSSAAAPERHGAGLFAQPLEAERVRGWDARSHWSNWNNWRLGDLGWYGTTGGGSTTRVISIPLWLVVNLVSVPCWLHVGSLLRARRRRGRGQCVNCGYRRTELPPDAACPECGSLPGIERSPSRLVGRAQETSS